MSKELVKTVESYDKYYATHGLDDACIDAYVKAIDVALRGEQDLQYGMALANRVSYMIGDCVKKNTGGTLMQLEQYAMDNHLQYNLINKYYDIKRITSYWDFESYMSFVERMRPQEKRFYLPRKSTLHPVAQDLMDLDNRKIKFYGLSMPPRVGKSTICIFFLSWIAMKRPNSHSAMGGHSGILAKGFYKELLNIMTSEEYCFPELYSYWNPSREIIRDKSAEDLTITLDQPDRFPTVCCRGIDGTWTGAVDISKDGYLYVDDLIRDREHSLNPRRMEDTFQEYLNKMVDRKNDGARELMVGTLWNVNDPLERIRTQYDGDPEYRFRKIPALDSNDESNFDYPNIGFSTEYYRDIRDRLDNAEWMAKYQQQPYVREGLLFQKDEMLYSDGIMPEETHRMWAILDPAVGGGDSLSMPICWEGRHRTIVDWVFNKGTQKITVPLIADKIQKHFITELFIEKNGVGRLFEDEIKRELKKRGVNHCKIWTYSAPVGMSKEDKIRGYSDAIKENFYFLMEKKYIEEPIEGQYVRSEEYDVAMSEMFMYTSLGKNPHDDAPDSMAQMQQIVDKGTNGKVEVVSNPFRHR